MGFDPNSAGQPIVNVHKKTTQVNVWMAIGVALFLALCVVLVMRSRGENGPDQTHRPEEQQGR